jgi:hypothetical protein
MGKEWSYINTSGINRAACEAICPVGEYRVVDQGGIPSFIPEDLRRKADGALIVASGSLSGNMMFMVNIHRVDQKVSAIDQEPFAIVFNGPTSALSGCIIHHGDWGNRTVSPPQEFWSALAASGLGNCYPFSELPPNASGPIGELAVQSQHDAFKALNVRLKNCFTTGG